MFRTIVLALMASVVWAQDARAILTRSIEETSRTTRLAEQYTYRELTVDREGSVTTTRLYEILTLGGKRHRHLLEKDGKPLAEKDARKAQEALDKALAEANRITPEERQKREEQTRRRNEQERDRLKYIPDAFDISLAGERSLNGRQVYEIRATPRASYHGKYDNILRNLRGTLFIDKADYQWVRMEAEALDNISLGLVLARIAKGSRFTFEVTKVNDEVWLPKRVTLDATGRLALLKKIDASVDVTFSDYRKFQAESRITSVSETVEK